MPDRSLEPGPPASRHPDREWLASIRLALDRWEAASPVAQPTSSVLGSGAVAVAEATLSARLDDRQVLLLPSASYGLRVALAALGVQAGDEVLLPALDWPASWAAARSLGATPIPVPVDARTLTIDPVAAARRRSERTKAAVACHLHGVCADIPALRSHLPALPVVEDAAGAFGSTLDGRPAGTLGDLGVLSFGPGKSIDVGEAAALSCADPKLYARALHLATHPLRQLLAGLPSPPGQEFSIRPHPMAAVLLWAALETVQQDDLAARRRALVTALNGSPGVATLEGDGRRTSSQACVPVLLGGKPAVPSHWLRSSAAVLAGLDRVGDQLTRDLRSRCRLVPVPNSVP